MSEALKHSELPKRFYREVRVVPAEEGHAVELDGRPVRTPGRKALVLSREDAAQALAAEWGAQRERIDPATMPLTRLVNTVLDGIAADPMPVHADLKRYAKTDLLFYRADAPEPLVERQRGAWDPILEWAAARAGGRFVLAEGVMHVAQPPETLAGMSAWLDHRQDPFEIAALHQMTTLTGSLILALAIAESRVSLDDGWAAAHLDEDWNIEQWGADEEAATRRRARFAEMQAAAILLQIPANHS